MDTDQKDEGDHDTPAPGGPVPGREHVPVSEMMSFAEDGSPPSLPGIGRRKLVRPLMVFDGNCNFCRHWIARLQEITKDRIDYASSQEVAVDFPGISQSEFDREVKLIEPDGQVFGGAEAAAHAIFDGGKSALSGAPLWIYRSVPGARSMADAGYRVVARNRVLFSMATRWLWGNNVRVPTYFTARAWFLRALGVIFLIAFASLRIQVDGLIGKEGILPLQGLMNVIHERFGGMGGFALFPTLNWFIGGGDGALHFLCNAGMGLSLLLIAGVAPAACLALLWVFYLSLVTAGQTFLSFQWDALLLEVGFLSIFIAPLRWLPRRGDTPPLSRTGLFLMRWLLFRFVLMSGIVKLTSGDTAWWDFSALTYHYQTQPLPTWIGWWTHQGSAGFQTVSLVFVFVAELIAPFFVFGPRRVRFVGFVLLMLLQALIAATGNYGFFNFLTAALCLLLVDDLQWPRKLIVARPLPDSRSSRFSMWVLAPLAAVYVIFGALLLWEAVDPVSDMPFPFAGIYRVAEPFRTLNSYGLFRVMTRTRREIVIEGSNDGDTWLAYDFHWKPGDVTVAPRFIAPYQPRLDWQMWFAALENYDDDRWFTQFLTRLLQGSPPVLGLLAHNPFPQAPPRYVRARLYDYRFTTPAARRETGAYWRREYLGPYCPVLSLRSAD